MINRIPYKKNRLYQFRKITKIIYCYISICSINIITQNQVTLSQVIPSNSTNTSINTQITNGKSIDKVTGGITKSTNLFHEFSRFDVNKNNSVLFVNPLSINNIIATIQSDKVSTINSLIGVDGPANLFLLNRNGFIFGPNATLQLQGSFLASTANRLTFSDGFEYYTSQANQNINTRGNPVKLSLSKESGSISINGNGHTLSFIPVEGEVRNPTIISGAGESSDGIRIKPSQSISLISNGVYLNGGIITAPSSNVFISSISSGTVDFNFSDKGLTYQNSAMNQYNDITLTNKSLIDSSGISNSRISLFGENIYIRNASYVLNQNVNNFIPSKILVNANKSLQIEGTTDPSLFKPFNAPSNVQSSIFAQNLFGSGTNIIIDAENIALKNGGTIEGLSLYTGSTGNIDITSSKSININGESLLEPIQSVSTIILANFGSSQGEILTVNTNNLNIEKAGSISSGTFSSGRGSVLKLNIADTLYLDGFSSITSTPSLISSTTLRDGRAGNIEINANNISIANGGVITANTLASGSSGDIFIKNKNLSIDGDIRELNVDGKSLITPSGIAASGIPNTPLFQFFFRVPPFPTGNSGNVNINSNNIQILNNGRIGVENGGSGNAGNLLIRSNQLYLSKKGTISASTSGGDGGNINIFAKELILRNAFISASALKEGLGGNININSEIFVGFGSSSISTNAQNARGGNITFNTKGFFPSRDTEITATSDLGLQFSGTVTLNTPDTDLDTATTTLQTDLSKPEISSICQPTSADSYSEFISTGEGGLPTGAADPLSSTTGWHDPSGGVEQPSALLVENIPEINHIDDAQGWVKNPDGTMSLVATANVPITQAENSNNCNAQNPVSPSSDRLTTNPHTTSNSPSTLSTRSESTEAKASNLIPSR